MFCWWILEQYHDIYIYDNIIIHLNIMKRPCICKVPENSPGQDYPVPRRRIRMPGVDFSAPHVTSVQMPLPPQTFARCLCFIPFWLGFMRQSNEVYSYVQFKWYMLRKIMLILASLGSICWLCFSWKRCRHRKARALRRCTHAGASSGGAVGIPLAERKKKLAGQQGLRKNLHHKAWFRARGCRAN